MPMHDWTRVEPNMYHDFYVGWIAAFQQLLNNGGLPPAYYAHAELIDPSCVHSTDQRADGYGSRKHRRIAIRLANSQTLVAAILIISPGNKASKTVFSAFVEMSISLVKQSVHLLVIDPFPPTPRDPNGLHAAIWRGLVRKRFTPPADKSLTLAAYAAEPDERFAAYVEPLAVGGPIPDMPLFLTPTAYVNVPLEETYKQAWTGFPAPWKDVIEGR